MLLRIEDCWEDYTIYYIIFKTLNNRIIYKTVALMDKGNEYTKSEISQIVIQRFSNVLSVEHIDYVSECLVMKND